MVHKDGVIMDQLTDKDFLDFLESFNEKIYEDEHGKTHKCKDSLKELSKSDSYPYDSIIDDDELEMYGLDWMVRTSDIWKDKSRKCKKNPRRCKHHFPKTTDAINCRKGEKGNLILDVIEFKFISDESNHDKLDNLHKKIVEKHNKQKYKQEEQEEIAEDLAYFLEAEREENGAESSDTYEPKEEVKCFDDDFLEDFNSIKEGYVDNIQNSLQLKPYEAVFIVLPMLYEEYCEESDETKKDFKGYLYNMEKYFWVCVDSGTKNEDNLKRHTKFFENYYKRMEPVIFKRARAKSKKDFEQCLKKEILSI